MKAKVDGFSEHSVFLVSRQFQYSFKTVCCQSICNVKFSSTRATGKLCEKCKVLLFSRLSIASVGGPRFIH